MYIRYIIISGTKPIEQNTQNTLAKHTKKKEIIVTRQQQTTREESACCKAEGDRGQRICHQEHKQNRQRHIAHHRSILASVDSKENGFNESRDQDKDEIFDEPRQPVKPVTEAHHLHRLLVNSQDSVMIMIVLLTFLTILGFTLCTNIF